MMMTTRRPPVTQIEDLTAAYWMEIETVMNYLAAATNLEGLRGKQVADVLRRQIEDELGHATRFAQRLNELGGVVPGSLDFTATHKVQPPADPTDVPGVIGGVLDAENAAIAHYRRIVDAAEGIDPVTQNLAITVLAEEEAHRHLFQGFARESEFGRS